MTADMQIKVDGRWLPTIGVWSDLSYSTLADGGCGEASWNMQLDRGVRHPSLRRGALVEIRTGARNVYMGVLAEPDDTDDGWSFHADGLAVEGAGYIAFDASLNTTSTPNTAIDQAIARGLRWTRPTSIGSTPFVNGDATDGLAYLSQLLDDYAQSLSQRWGVNEYGQVYLRSDPTTPMWHMTPGSGTFGLADDEYASDVFLRYYTTTLGLATSHAGDAAAAARFGRKEYAIDGRDLGPLTTGVANGYSAGFVAKGAARLGWTNSLTPSRWQLTTAGGTPAYLPAVRAGQMVRLHGVRDDQGQVLPYVDFVIGQTTHDVGENTLTIAPVGLAARTLSDVLAVIGSDQ